MTFWAIITVMAAQFLGFTIGIVFEVALNSINKYAALANLALYAGLAVYGCLIINVWLLIPFAIFAVIGNLVAPIILNRYRKRIGV